MMGEDSSTSKGNSPELRLRHRGADSLSDVQVERRRKVVVRIRAESNDVWRWTGQAKTAKGQKYPQIVHTLGNGLSQLVNARHVVFYLATGWVHEGVQQYRTRDGDPLNVHPDNLVPTPALQRARSNNYFWDTERLKDYYG